ncbi:WD40-repeat-containing domain protein [Radiomyces spectabilis]|uniref:WD40-repeat-containing domain protein n=1 Tax=Radiomyces spectabilis TaxID=64574 RepID=UPI00221F007C|nr:WD40-repeat-containing domain protein [Radiomyces spectabilis]KAI8379206.1 WD40-repeat-containing domain protein [Radiomyces spectabilis]
MDSPNLRKDSPIPLGNISKYTGLKPLYPTRCVHTISQEDDSSVLSLAASRRYLFSGSQSSKIHVWDLQTFTLINILDGHRGSVLGLTLSDDQQWLFSCSGDGTVRVWDTETLKCAYLIQSCHDVGDIFSIVYSEQSNMFFFGSQNTSIQWYDFADPQTHGSSTDVPIIPITPRNSQKSKFFENHDDGDDSRNGDSDVIQCVIREKNVYLNAHDGYVYCLLHSTDVPNIDGEVLISGSGDGDVKIWSIKSGELHHLKTLKGNSDMGVLSLALSEDGYLFCGVQGGDVQIWDLETYQLIRSMMAHADDVLSIAIKQPGLISASADGTIKVWGQSFEFRESMDDHDGIVLSMTTSDDYLITGSSDHSIKFWDMPSLSNHCNESQQFRRKSLIQDVPSSEHTLLYVLEKWIAMRTVSGNPEYLEECRRGARFLKNVLQQLGAVSRMIPGQCGRNPLVYGKFYGKQQRGESMTEDQKIPTVLIYGHYDVINAENENQEWISDPFTLTGRNGYLYGRGTTDNKGPLLACIFAVNELLNEGLLDANVIFLIEGEEESGSIGFYQAIEKHKDLFADVDIILLSNSYWLGEDMPCLTYGLRGVVHASIEISNTRADLHSGVEGGAVSEPLVDLIHVLSKLVDNEKRVLIPGFYDRVRSITDAEEKLYDPIIEWMQKSEKTPSTANHSRNSTDMTADGKSSSPLDEQQLKNNLMSRWRYPTLTVHKIDVSINNPTIIPRRATATVSMRVVPDQNIKEICQQFEGYVKEAFQSSSSENQISVGIQSAADYWLGNPENKYFKALEKAIEQEWHQKPLYIREGGSIPAVRWLEVFCNAPAVHLPMGQSSDHAHLHNERIRLRNLYAGKRIVKSLLRNLPTKEVKE